MIHRFRRARQRAFTLIELLVVVIILGILTAIVLPNYITSVFSGRQITANSNARILAEAIQHKALLTGSYDSTLADYVTDMGGRLPMNPCTATTTGYTITVTSSITATVVASSGTNCGSWIPTSFNMTF